MKIGKQEVEVKIGAGVTGTPIIGLAPKKKTEKSRKTLKTKIKDKSRISSEAKESESGTSRLTGFIDLVNGKTEPYDEKGQGTHVAATILGLGQEAEKQGGKALDGNKMTDKEIEKAVAEGKMVVKAAPRENRKIDGIEIQPLSMPDYSASYEIKEKAEQILNSDSIGDKKQNPKIFANGKEVDRKDTYTVKFHEHPSGWSGPAGE